jgi:predicted RNase H-like nuclease
MPNILAIDAAWTPNHPSGVAVVTGDQSLWQCKAVAPSYDDFINLTSGYEIDWAARNIQGTPPDIPRLIEAAEKIAGLPIDLVSVDMPISKSPFSSRRAADNIISRQFGGRWCAAHSPNANRPGKLGIKVSRDLNAAGFHIATKSSSGSTPCLIEVYPHPALLSLLGCNQRIPYKVGKSNKYWPGNSTSKRIENLLSIFREIYAALVDEFGSLPFMLPEAKDVARLSQLKRYEDALDALVCAWVGVKHLEGKTEPLGDDTAAIWCPRDVVSNGKAFRA